MAYELWIGRTLYFSTHSIGDAFRMFRKFSGKGNNVHMKFVTVKRRAA